MASILLRKILLLAMGVVPAITNVHGITVHAKKKIEQYPYTMFAASCEEGAKNVDSDNNAEGTPGGIRHDWFNWQMKITVNFITLSSVVYAIICSAFLPENSPPQYYRSALISLVIMIFILLSRFIYILTNNSDVNKKRSEINNIILFLMYFFTGLFELNVRFGYGNTIGISGEEEK